jgi:serine protease Do
MMFEKFDVEKRAAGSGAAPTTTSEIASRTTATSRSKIASKTKSFLVGAVALSALAVAGALEGGVFLHNPAFAQQNGHNLTAAVPGQASFADVVEKVKPAVVSVRVKSEARARNPRLSMEEFGIAPGSPMERFFRRFEEDGRGQRNAPQAPQAPRRQFSESQGSGFFISKDGYIVTNNHVVERGQEVQVVTDEGKTVTARVVGTDPKTDLAVLKAQDDGPYPFVDFAAKEPRVGDWVIAVGNPFGLGGTVTAGIVSARGRDIGAGPYDDFIQIDAPVNRGNSGGPTFNILGEVVGVNTAIASPSGGSVGIAFAIPSEAAKRIVAEIRDTGSVRRGFLGVQIQSVTRDIADSMGLDRPQGALVAKVDGESPAGKAGVREGDAIVSLNGRPVRDARELSREVAALAPESSASLQVWRDGKSREVTVKLGRMPGDQAAAASRDRREENPGAQGPAQERNTDLASPEAGGLGLSLAPAGSVGGVDKKGVVVTNVASGSMAEERGVKTGDVIVEVSGRTVETPADVQKALSESRGAGKRAVLFRLETEQGPRFVALPVPRG